jgi:CheY-like chemotaxis protein
MTAGSRILIVDDDPRNRKLIEALLASEGYAVQGVESGAAGLVEIVRTPPDLVLLDLMMPGMDGFEFMRRLRADPGTAAVPVIVVTALDDPASRARVAAAGAAGTITKPVNRWELKASVERLLGKRDG